ncbi:MAG: hypothetical protein QXO22_07185 [Thermosphaera sp.]
MSDLFAKIRRAFGDYAVDKSLLQIAEISKLPGFVAELLDDGVLPGVPERLAGETEGVYTPALLRG